MLLSLLHTASTRQIASGHLPRRNIQATGNTKGEGESRQIAASSAPARTSGTRERENLLLIS
jgi:hypothetical protein